jgi:hypothetical protein
VFFKNTFVSSDKIPKKIMFHIKLNACVLQHFACQFWPPSAVLKLKSANKCCPAWSTLYTLDPNGKIYKSYIYDCSH